MRNLSKQPPLHPNEIIRYSKGGKFFGYKSSQLDELIKSGEIPRPIPLSASGRAKGWTGQQIIDHQARLIERDSVKTEEA